MRGLAIGLLFAGALASGPALAQWSEETLQRRFVEGMQQLEAGDLAQAESVFRELLTHTGSPRVKLELARTLYLQGKLGEAKKLFNEVATQSDTPWRVVDNVQHFVQQIEERSGYLKFGVTMISDSNPRNLAAQKEFAIGDLRVTPTEAPKKMYGLRYSARAWMPVSQLGGGGYVTASYNDYSGHNLDRLTVDGGVSKNLTDSGSIRGKAGVEFGTFGGKRLYHFPYLGLDSVLAESPSYRFTGELKLGKVRFADFPYLDATNTSAAFSARKVISDAATVSMSSSVERSSANERPYSYYGWELGPGINTFWPGSALLVGARASIGARKYADVDPLFGERRADAKHRVELSVGNKNWRWRNSYVSFVASLEENRSNIGFYSYRKTNVSVVVE
jgi:outer membrane protein